MLSQCISPLHLPLFPCPLPRFLNGCDQDVREARRRWDITRKWRQDEGINDILSELDNESGSQWCRDEGDTRHYTWLIVALTLSKMHTLSVCVSADEAQPHYKTIKTMYPHYYCAQSRDGVHAYYERPGEIEIEQVCVCVWGG